MKSNLSSTWKVKNLPKLHIYIWSKEFGQILDLDSHYSSPYYLVGDGDTSQTVRQCQGVLIEQLPLTWTWWLQDILQFKINLKFKNIFQLNNSPALGLGNYKTLSNLRSTQKKRIYSIRNCKLSNSPALGHRQHCRLSIWSHFGWVLQIQNLRRAGLSARTRWLQSILKF